jgi:hypothetical protein
VRAALVASSSNQILDAARAPLPLRTVPNMDSRGAGELVVKKLTTRPPTA